MPAFQTPCPPLLTKVELSFCRLTTQSFLSDSRNASLDAMTREKPPSAEVPSLTVIMVLLTENPARETFGIEGTRKVKTTAC